MKPIEIKVRLDPLDFLYDMAREELLELVYEIDIMQSDVDFTKQAIKNLCMSLRCDCSEEEWEAFVKEI